MAGKHTVSVRIRGQDFRVRTDDDEASLQRVASYLDATLSRVAERTGTIDSLDVALLTGLNLARELVAIRDGRDGAGGLDLTRLQELTDLVEGSIAPDTAEPA